MTSLATSYWQLSKLKKGRKCRLRRLRVEFLENGFVPGPPNCTRLSGTMAPTDPPDMMSLAASGRLQHVIKYCAKVHKKTGAAGKESNNSATV